MRQLLFFITLPIVLISGNRDSLYDKQYKVRFSVQDKILNCKLHYTYDESYYGYYHGYSSGSTVYCDGNINSISILNPELKVDVKLPLWLKMTCGVNYNTIRFNSGYGEMYDVVNFEKDKTTGHFKDNIQLSTVGAFIGLGLVKQYRNFNFDLDYSFSAYKALYGKRSRSYYDINYNFQNTDVAKNIEYGGGLESFVFSHNFSASISYCISKNINLKLGYMYSMYVKDIYHEEPAYYTRFKNNSAQGIVFGIGFSII